MTAKTQKYIATAAALCAVTVVVLVVIYWASAKQAIKGVLTNNYFSDSELKHSATAKRLGLHTCMPFETTSLIRPERFTVLISLLTTPSVLTRLTRRLVAPRTLNTERETRRISPPDLSRGIASCSPSWLHLRRSTRSFGKRAESGYMCLTTRPVTAEAFFRAKAWCIPISPTTGKTN